MTRRNWKGFTAEDFRKYYEENYSGMSRSRVAKKDTGFYQAIWGKGLVDAVFPKPIRNNWQDFTKEDFQKYYDDNCKGMTRKEVLQANRSFYGAVQRSGLWSYIIPPSRGRWEDWNLEDFKNYYHDNYRGRTRTEISKVESSFVSAAYRKGIADDVFPPVKKKPRGGGKVSHKYGAKKSKFYFGCGITETSWWDQKSERRIWGRT